MATHHVKTPSSAMLLAHGCLHRNLAIRHYVLPHGAVAHNAFFHFEIITSLRMRSIPQTLVYAVEKEDCARSKLLTPSTCTTTKDRAFSFQEQLRGSPRSELNSAYTQTSFNQASNSCLVFTTWNLPALVLQSLTPAAVTCESGLAATTTRPTRNHQCLFNLIYQHKTQVISSCHSCCVTLWLPQAVLKQLKAPQWRSADPDLLLPRGSAIQILKVDISLQATLLPPNPKSPLHLLPNTARPSGSQRCRSESL